MLCPCYILAFARSYVRIRILPPFEQLERTAREYRRNRKEGSHLNVHTRKIFRSFPAQDSQTRRADGSLSCRGTEQRLRLM
ncbi:hypothetical protein EVAR_55456_1 [Eumeta japonica]|uniref:Uncharacterized protein n=1 Tax=Eumeta variegata TaxID=151549 RepID=A0A4C1Y2K2_EUMVA|nr:hypothetical protein EVAR_55456_1 [Eumeta japonica]